MASLVSTIPGTWPDQLHMNPTCYNSNLDEPGCMPDPNLTKRVHRKKNGKSQIIDAIFHLKEISFPAYLV